MKSWEVVADFLTIIALVVVSTFVGALVIKILWSWYVSDLAPLSIKGAIGIIIVVRFALQQYPLIPEEKKIYSYAKQTLFMPLAFLVGGAILHFGLFFF